MAGKGGKAPLNLAEDKHLNTGKLEKDADWRGYLNYNLSEEQRAGHDQWAVGEDFYLCFERTIADGIAVTVKIDPKHNIYLASATQRRSSSPNAGLCVTTRATTPILSLSRLLYTLWLLGVEARWEDKQPMANPDRW